MEELTELQMRIARYLYKGHANVLDLNENDIPTVEGYRIPQDVIYFAATAREAAFEECIARLYENEKYNRRTRFLGRRWKILDWMYGPLEQRLHRHQFLRYDGRTAAERRSYAEYMGSKLQYEKQGKVRPLAATYYNERRLEELLPEKQWQDLQILKHGVDHQPPPLYDKVIYNRPAEVPGIPAPPPQFAEYLLSIIRGITFERNSIG